VLVSAVSIVSVIDRFCTALDSAVTNGTSSSATTAKLLAVLVVLLLLLLIITVSKPHAVSH
jgi:hypothetical protein